MLVCKYVNWTHAQPYLHCLCQGAAICVSAVHWYLYIVLDVSPSKAHSSKLLKTRQQPNHLHPEKPQCVLIMELINWLERPIKV